MEGDLIAVSSTVTLPDQPTSGTVSYVPLGGDGFSAPFASYNIRSMGVTGAAGGGSAVLRVNMDPRFCSLVAFIALQNAQVSALDADFKVRIASDRMAVPTHSGLITAINASVASVTVSTTWEPPPIVLPGGGANSFLDTRMLNVDSDEYTIDVLIYLFDIRVRELTPMGPLLFARGSN